MRCDTFILYQLGAWGVVSKQSEDVNRGGAHWVRIVGGAVTLRKADGH